VLVECARNRPIPIQAVFYIVFDPANYLYFKVLYRGLWLFTSRCSAKWWRRIF